MGYTYCSDCDNLVKDKKKKGKSSGALYYCKKMEKFIDPTNSPCSGFAKCYLRNSFDNQEIYNDGKAYSNDTSSPGKYLFILIAVVVIGIILMIIS